MKELLQQALDALESDPVPLNAINNASAFLRTALAAPQPEAVGEVYRYGRDSHDREWHGIHWYNADVDVPTGTKLYAAPPAAPAPAVPEEYDMAEEGGCPTCGEDGGTSCGMPNCGLLQGADPAVREPLTQDQIVGLAANYEEAYHRWVFICVDELEQFVRAVERAHGIGGGGNG